MKAWAERSSGERAGIIGGIAAAVIALIFGATRLTAPPPPETPPAAAGGDATATAPETAAEAPAAPAGEGQGAAADTAGMAPAPADGTAPAAEDTAAETSPEGSASPDQDQPAADTADAEPAAEPAVAGTDEAASESAPADATAADAAPAEADTPEATPAPAAPEFDLVRVARDGSAVVAGSAAPGSTVRLLLDGVGIGSVPATAQGSFVALFNLAPSTAPRILTLVSVLPDGAELAAAGRIVISPTVAPERMAEAPEQAADAPDAAPVDEAPAAEAPAALLVTDEGARVLQSAGDLSPAMASNVTVDTITYTPEGAVQLSGRGTGGAVVRLYLDNAQVADTTVDAQGGWTLTLDGIEPGLYTMRADQIGPDGQVTSRFETPFQRETAEALAAAAEALAATEGAEAAPADAAQGTGAATAQGPVSVTVQPGFTLWRIARENLGEGVLYVQVFEANRDQIRDPDLIYPGQVFAIPGAD